MRTAMLTFQDGHLVVTHGIRVADSSDDATLHLFAHPDRVIHLKYMKACPPRLIIKEKVGTTEPRFLGLLTLARMAGTGEWIATEEQSGDMGVNVLLMIDTLDESDRGRRGSYFPPTDYDSRMPHACHPTPGGGSDFGLVVFRAGSSCILRSTRGDVAKLTLNPNGDFSVVPCTRSESLLLSMEG